MKKVNVLRLVFCAVLVLGAFGVFSACTSNRTPGLGSNNGVSPDEINVEVFGKKGLSKEQFTFENTPGGVITKESPLDDISAFYNQVWQLVKVRFDYGALDIDRKTLDDDDMGDYFILQFVSEGVNGRAAPNRYFAPYSLKDGHNIALRPMVSTKEASNFTAGGVFSEKEFYQYLQNINAWNFVLNTLYLFSTNPNTQDEVVLVFTPAPQNITK